MNTYVNQQLKFEHGLRDYVRNQVRRMEASTEERTSIDVTFSSESSEKMRWKVYMFVYGADGASHTLFGAQLHVVVDEMLRLHGKSARLNELPSLIAAPPIVEIAHSPTNEDDGIEF